MELIGLLELLKLPLNSLAGRLITLNYIYNAHSPIIYIHTSHSLCTYLASGVTSRFRERAQSFPNGAHFYWIAQDKKSHLFSAHGELWWKKKESNNNVTSWTSKKSRNMKYHTQQRPNTNNNSLNNIPTFPLVPSSPSSVEYNTSSFYRLLLPSAKMVLIT